MLKPSLTTGEEGLREAGGGWGQKRLEGQGAGLRRADQAGPTLREGILKTAKVLVEDTKVLVQNAAGSQEKLAQAAQSSVATITRLADVVKLGAASLGAEDPETQVST